MISPETYEKLIKEVGLISSRIAVVEFNKRKERLLAMIKAVRPDLISGHKV